MSVRQVAWILGAIALLWGSDAVRAQTPDSSRLSGWGRMLGADPRVIGEMGRFDPNDASGLTEEYRVALADRLRSEVFGAADRVLALLASGQCEPFVDVSFPGSGAGMDYHVGASLGAEAFEAGLVRTESLTCVEGSHLDAAAALALYVSPEFRLEAEGRIQEIRAQDAESCERTAGTLGLLDPTSSCSRVSRTDRDAFSAYHSQVVGNSEEEGYQTVFFKESLKTVFPVTGGLAIHHIHLSRSRDIGRLERWIGEGAIRSSEEDTVALLERRLRETPHAPSSGP
jgi:hypothetical protein